MEVALQQMCRTCLVSGGALISLHSASAQTFTVGQMLTNFSNIQVSETDKFPTKVCLSCVSEIKRCYFFKIKCESSQDTLQQYLHEIVDGTEEETVLIKPEAMILEANVVSEAPTQQSDADNGLHEETIAEDDGAEDGEVEIHEEHHETEDALTESDDENEQTSVEIMETVETSNEFVESDILADEKLILIGCEECCRAFETQEEYQAHVAKCSGMQSTKNKRNQSKNDKSKVSKTNKRRIPSEPKKCPNCPMEFVHDRNLEKHVIKFHFRSENTGSSPVKTQSNQEKDAKFESEEEDDDSSEEIAVPDAVTEDAILKPEIATLASVQHTCSKCGAGFVNKKSLQSHLKINKCTITQFICKICSKVFNSDKSLIEHVKEHAKAFKCTKCPKAFPTSTKLKRHNQMTHDLKHQCIHCGKGFGMYSTLEDHLRIHSGEKPFLCTICGKGFTQKTNLTQHINRHKNLKPFKCKECELAFVSKGELNAHMRKHTGDHPFTCDQCTASFTTSSSLVKHKRIHTGERPYACDLCPMRFLALGTLKNHRRTHTGEKPYKCEYCHRAFTQKTDCATHMRSHTGERPYICSICCWTFPHSSTLKTHMKTHDSSQTSAEENNDNDSKIDQESMEVELITADLDEEDNY